MDNSSDLRANRRHGPNPVDDGGKGVSLDRSGTGCALGFGGAGDSGGAHAGTSGDFEILAETGTQGASITPILVA
jgi:hypothetical protein